jgi:hypothetical protein
MDSRDSSGLVGSADLTSLDGSLDAADVTSVACLGLVVVEPAGGGGVEGLGGGLRVACDAARTAAKTISSALDSKSRVTTP